jgi:hypothetical protein
MMKRMFLAALVIGFLPVMAKADGRYYDRGYRYSGHGHSNSFFGISLGFGSNDWFGGFSYSSGGYYPRYAYPGYYPAYRPMRYYAPAYYAPEPAPVVIYREPVYAPPPVMVYPNPSYYYAPAKSYYAPSNRYYYGR